jgi:hypothetical protein
MSIFGEKKEKTGKIEVEHKEQWVKIVFEDGQAYIETPEDNPIDYPHLLQSIAALKSLQRHMEDTLKDFKEEQGKN